MLAIWQLAIKSPNGAWSSAAGFQGFKPSLRNSTASLPHESSEIKSKMEDQLPVLSPFKKPWSHFFCILKLHPVQKCSGKTAAILWAGKSRFPGFGVSVSDLVHLSWNHSWWCRAEDVRSALIFVLLCLVKIEFLSVTIKDSDIENFSREKLKLFLTQPFYTACLSFYGCFLLLLQSLTIKLHSKVLWQNWKNIQD